MKFISIPVYMNISLTLKEITNTQESILDLVVLDFGAGVGLIGEFLKNQAVRTIVGIDLVKAAKEVVNRDRPNIYYQYYVEDLSDPNESTRSTLEQMRFNCLTCVSSLNVIPSLAWRNVYNMISNGGWIGLNIVEDALSEFPSEQSLAGSNELIRQLIEQGILEVKVKKTYQHRVSAFGKPIMYVAFIGRKTADISMNLCKQYYRPIWK